jgi:hypothetical protein
MHECCVPIVLPFVSKRLSIVRPISARLDAVGLNVILTRLKLVLPATPVALDPVIFIVLAVPEFTCKLRPDASSATLTNDTRLAGYVTVNPNAPKLLEPVLT